MSGTHIVLGVSGFVVFFSCFALKKALQNHRHQHISVKNNQIKLASYKLKLLLVEINDKKTPHNMKKYFYTDGTNKFGPFTLEELKEKEITRETNVWFYELGEWKNAGVIAEIQDLFTLVPPPIQKQNTNTQFSTTRKSERNTIEIFVFSSIAYWFTVDSINFINWLIWSL